MLNWTQFLQDKRAGKIQKRISEREAPSGTQNNSIWNVMKQKKNTEKDDPCLQSVSSSSSITDFPCIMSYFFIMMKMIWWTLLKHQAACVELLVYHDLHCVSYLKFAIEETDIAKLNLPWVMWLITDGDGTGLTVSSPLLFDYIHPLHSVTLPPTCQDHIWGISNASYISILCGLTLRTNSH